MQLGNAFDQHNIIDYLKQFCELYTVYYAISFWNLNKKINNDNHHETFVNLTKEKCCA